MNSGQTNCRSGKKIAGRRSGRSRSVKISKSKSTSYRSTLILQVYLNVERGVSGVAAYRADAPRRRDASCCGRLAPAANASDLSIKRDVVWMAFNAARIWLKSPD